MVGWLVIAAGLMAAGQDKPPPNPLVEALARCLEIKEDAERLRCTDVAAARLVAAEQARELVVVSRDEVKRTKRSLFGLGIDENRVFAGREAPADRVDRLETTITSATPSERDRWTLVLVDGGRWRTSEPWPDARPRPGAAVVVRRGPLGSYVLTTKGERAVRVTRVN